MKNLIGKIMFHLFTDEQYIVARGSNIPSSMDMTTGNALEDSIPKQLVLLCSEKAVYVYSLTHAIQVTGALFMWAVMNQGTA